MGFIYRIVNDINGKSYVGKTEDSVSKRFSEHCAEAFRKRSEIRPLYSAMRKYGIENFRVETIEETDDTVARETFWIEHFGTYKDGYNATRGGDGKQIFDYDRILDELIICPDVDFVADKIGCSRDTVSAVARRYSIDTAKDISLNFGNANTLRMKTVRAQSEDGNQYADFHSISEAAAWLFEIGATKSSGKSVLTHISDCAKGKTKSAYGLVWKFI